MGRTILVSLACLAAAACSRNDANGTNGNTNATTSNAVPASNAINDNPSGATPLTNEPSAVGATQQRAADGLEYAGAGREAGVAVGGGPNGLDTSTRRTDGGAWTGASGSDDKSGPGSSAKGVKRADDGASCPGESDVRVAGKNGSAGFCARACRSDIDCAPNGKCAGTGETSAKGYSQPNGKYCTGM